MTDSKKIELAKKLKALAEQGEAGEKQVAEFKLKEFMRKHGITDEDIESEKIEAYFFYIGPDSEKLKTTLLNQICGTMGLSIRGPIAVKDKRKYKMKEDFGVHCTASQYIEISAKFEFYKNILKSDLKTFIYAFAMKHDLLIKASENKDKPTNEDQDIARKALIMSMGLNDELKYQKKITNSNE